MFTTRYLVGDLPVHTAGIKETLLKFIGTVRYPIQSRRWAQFLETHPPLMELADFMPDFFTKIYRPYYSTRLRCSERVDLLIDHYEIMLRLGFANLIRQTMIRPITVHSFSGKSNTIYRLELTMADASSQNGELVLRLMMGDICVYTVAFVLTAASGETSVNVGALKGILATSERMGVKQITRDLYGCQPKDLMLALVREAGDCLGCAKIILISNEHRIMPTEKYFCKKSSNYDRTWKEMHAVSRSDGDFELPCTRIPPEPDGATDCASSSPFMPTRRSMLIDTARRALRKRLNAEQPAAIRRHDNNP